VAKAELGTKRVCPTTGRKFYDLNQNPVISPYTGEIVPIAPVATSRSRPSEAMRGAAPAAAVEAEAPEAADAELVSLEEADADSSGSKKAATLDEADDDVEVADDDAGDDDDSTFLETDEDEGDDVSGIIGGDIESDEET
jgi:uncharacterized protein (TIGR02300 family)